MIPKNQKMKGEKSGELTRKDRVEKEIQGRMMEGAVRKRKRVKQ